VIGGRVASIAELPSLAFIRGKNLEGPFSCTGAMIAPRVVLTAGHCVEKPFEFAANPPSSYRVLTGTASNAPRPSNVSRVSRAIFFPNFETSKPQTDAGLLVLSAPVAAPALAIAKPSDPGLLAPGTAISIAGWGLTSPGAEEVPDLLHTGELAVQSVTYCRRHVRDPGALPRYTPASQLCALDRPRHRVSGCFGDSGGPAIAHRRDGTPVEVGIIVGGGPECSRSLPNIYTRVDRISSWVSAWVAAAERGAKPPVGPQPSPPFLSFAEAKRIVVGRLTRHLGPRFRRGTERQTHCARLAWERVRCTVAWRRGSTRHRASLTAYLVVRDDTVQRRTRGQAGDHPARP
jgi:secreted trypsin-like serine protease